MTSPARTSQPLKTPSAHPKASPGVKKRVARPPQKTAPRPTVSVGQKLWVCFQYTAYLNLSLCLLLLGIRWVKHGAIGTLDPAAWASVAGQELAAAVLFSCLLGTVCCVLWLLKLPEWWTKHD